MARISAVDTERIDHFVQELVDLDKRNEQLKFGIPRDFRMRQLESASQEMIATAKSILLSLANGDHAAPALEHFIHDQSVRDGQKVVDELRTIQERKTTE